MVMSYQILTLSQALQSLLYDLIYEMQKEGEKGREIAGMGVEERLSATLKVTSEAIKIK